MFTFFLDKTKNLTQDSLEYSEKLERLEFQKYDKPSDWIYGIGLLFCMPAYNAILSCLLIVELVIKLMTFIFLQVKKYVDKYSTQKKEDQRFSEHLYYCFISTLLPCYTFILLFLTIVYNLINCFHPLFSYDENQEKSKYREALLEYEQQLLLDLPEREEIIETLNTLFDKFDSYCNAFNFINSETIKHPQSQIKQNSSSEHLTNNIKTEYPNLDLSEKVSLLNFMINSYPSILNLTIKKSSDVIKTCYQRSEHHQQVKELAIYIFEEIQLIEKETEKCLEAQKESLPVALCNF